MTTMLSLIITGLFTTALFLWPGLELKKRRKWHAAMGTQMFLAGLGTVGIDVWLARLLSGFLSPWVVGGAGLIVCLRLLGGVRGGLFAEQEVDHPVGLFSLP